MSPQAENIKGNIIFAKNINMTHAQEYMKLNYDSSSEQKKFYFKIIPDKILGFCTSEELVGDWRVFFPETNYNVLNFKIKNQIVPGTEGDFDAIIYLVEPSGPACHTGKKVCFHHELK